VPEKPTVQSLSFENLNPKPPWCTGRNKYDGTEQETEVGG